MNQPFGVKTPRRGRIVCVVTLLVLFVLGVFQPFGIAEVTGSRKIVIVSLSAAGSLAGLGVILYLLPRLFPRYYAPEHWTVGKNILNQLSIVVAIGLCVGGFLVAWTTWSLGHAPAHASFHLFGELFLAVGIVSPIPLAVTAEMVRNQHLQSHLREMEEMNRYVSRLPESPASLAPEAGENLSRRETVDPAKEVSSPAVRLSGSTKDHLLLNPASLLYLESCGNYVKIFYEAEGKPKQKLLRATIKQMEDALQPYPFILRCHRAFLVNTDQVVRIQGNSQGYRLQFEQTEEEVPVSRAYTGTLRPLAIHPTSL